ncbi:MAG: phosphopantothenoylcysteine decarboxylase [Lentisphaerae bacterium]|nr:phosphopantothenoylcysteine decarboxylase [Lentisphaerota bacterium]
MSDVKHVVLGVTGGIAAYKAADLTSKLTQLGIVVHVVMTEAATKLVTPRTFQTLSRQPVTTSLWEVQDWRPEHVELGQLADLMVIAPCTANMMGKIAHGIADDALSTCVLANRAPLMLAPAMNPAMWQNPAVQDNAELLRKRNIKLIGPAEGHVACGPGGTGRMVEVAELVNEICKVLDINTGE